MNSSRSEYIARLNRVLDHIQEHLDEPMDLADLATVACFSPFHFHRMFKSWMGETLAQFIQRLRLERAAYQLYYSPSRSITEIALDNGFGSSSAFARAFKEHYGRSASGWRELRKMSQTDRNPGKANGSLPSPSWKYSGISAAPFQESNMAPSLNLDVQIQDLPPMDIAYVRHIGPFKGDSQLFARLFGKLCAWAGPRGLLGQTQFMGLYPDNPEITDPCHHRIEVAMSVPEGTPAHGEIGRKRLEGGRYAVSRIEILPQDFEAAWQTLMEGWLPDSGWQPDDRPALELYHNDPKHHPEGKHILEICLPVKAL